MEKMMPFDSEGNFTRMHNWEEDRQNDIDIMSDRMDEEDDNFANGFNDTMLRDGRATMTGNLKMGNFQVKNMAKGTVSTDAVNRARKRRLTIWRRSFSMLKSFRKIPMLTPIIFCRRPRCFLRGRRKSAKFIMAAR